MKRLIYPLLLVALLAACSEGKDPHQEAQNKQQEMVSHEGHDHGSHEKEKPDIEVHRSQDSTKHPSGSYLAQSTLGDFLVLLPFPFNDFTTKVEDAPVAHTVGTKNEAGIKFSATKVLKNEKQPESLDEIVEGLSTRIRVEVVNKDNYKDFESIYIRVYNPKSEGFMRYVKVPDGLILLSLEYPFGQKGQAEKMQDEFFNSLEVNM